MATVDLLFPGASPEALIAGLAAAGDVIRESGFSLEHLEAARRFTHEGLPGDDWRVRAAEVVRRAEIAAFNACSTQPPPTEAKLVFELRSFDHEW